MIRTLALLMAAVCCAGAAVAILVVERIERRGDDPRPQAAEAANELGVAA